MSSMASLTAPSDGTALTAAVYNGNNTTVRDFVNATAMKNDAAQTITTTGGTPLTLAYDGSHSATFGVDVNGKLTVNATTTVTITPALTVSGALTCSAAATVGTTLGVTGVATFSAAATAVVVTNAISANRFLLSSTNASYVAGSAYISTSLGLVLGGITGSSNDVTITNNAGTVVLACVTGGTGATFAGTLGVTGATTLAAVTCTTLAPSGNITVGASTFTVTAATGNVSCAAIACAAISPSGDINVNSSKFVVTATDGSLAIQTNKFTVSSAGAVGIAANLTMGTGTTIITAATATGQAGLRIPSGTAPTSPTSGDLWYDGTNLKFRDGAATRTLTWT